VIKFEEFIATLEKDKLRLETKQKELLSTIIEKTSLVSQLQAAASVSDGKMREYQSKASELAALLDTHEIELCSLRKELDSLTTKLDSATTCRDMLQCQLGEKNNYLQRVTKELEDERQLHLQELTQLKQQLTLNTSTAEQATQNLQTKLTETKRNAEETQAIVVVQNEQIEEMQVNLEQRKARVLELEEKLQEYELILRLQKEEEYSTSEQLASVTRSLNVATENQSTLNIQLEAAKACISEKEAMVNDISSRLKQVLEENAELTRTMEGYVARSSTLELEHSEVKEQLSSSRSEKKEMQLRVKELQDSLECMKSKFSSTLSHELENQKQMYETSIASLTAKCQMESSEKDSWKERFQELSEKKEKCIPVEEERHPASSDKSVEPKNSAKKTTTKTPVTKTRAQPPTKSVPLRSKELRDALEITKLSQEEEVKKTTSRLSAAPTTRRSKTEETTKKTPRQPPAKTLISSTSTTSAPASRTSVRRNSKVTTKKEGKKSSSWKAQTSDDLDLFDEVFSFL